MADEILDAVELEVRIAAAKSVREHMQATGVEQRPEDASALESLTDALINLRMQQIEKVTDSDPPPAD